MYSKCMTFISKKYKPMKNRFHTTTIAKSCSKKFMIMIRTLFSSFNNLPTGC